MSNPPPGNSGVHNAAWAKGWLPNLPAPEELNVPYEFGDTGSTWRAAPGSQSGPQPKGPNNPKGNVPGIPVMAITAKAARALTGDPRD